MLQEVESHRECHRRHPKKRGERRVAKGRVERVGDLRACGISERAHSFRNTGARSSSSWKTLLCPPGMGPQHELQRFLVLLPPYLYCLPPIPQSLRAAADRGGRPWKCLTLWMANHVVWPGRERLHRWGQGGGIWMVVGQEVLQRRGPDWAQSEAEGHPNDQNHIEQSQEAGRSSQTGLLQGRGEHYRCWTRDREEDCGRDAKVNLGRHSDQEGTGRYI